MLLINKKSKYLVGTISTIDSNFLGSCIPCKKGDHYYVITCGHVLYDTNFENLVSEIEKIRVTIDDVIYSVDQLIGDKSVSQKTDLAILRVIPVPNSESPPFLELSFHEPCDLSLNEESLLCLKPKYDESESLVPMKKFLRHKTDFSYLIEVAKDVFYNINTGSSGASAYKGVSGSGFFWGAGDNIYLSGVLSNIVANTLTTQLIMINPKALSLFWSDIELHEHSIYIKRPRLSNFHPNSPWKSEMILNELQNDLRAATFDDNYKIFICAPSDDSSTNLSKTIYEKLVSKLNSQDIDFIVGGGKGEIFEDDFYPHMMEKDILINRECNSIIIIADDHSTFSQLSLLSQIMCESDITRTDMYLFCQDEVIDKQVFMKSGPIKFFQEQVKGKLVRFSQFEDKHIDLLIKDIMIHKLCLKSSKRLRA